MKRVLLIALSLTLIIGLAYAKPMQPGPEAKAIEMEVSSRMPKSMRGAPEFVFTVDPTIVSVNYYDYMIGSYSGIPLKRKQDGDGYFMTYHGKATHDAQYRRVFYAAIDATGYITDQGTITRTAKTEGYPALAIDPVYGKPFYAWHANADSDPELEVEFVSDSYYFGMIGNFNQPLIAIDNPWFMEDPNPAGEGVGDTHDNEFIWPQMTTGPSPVEGMRRVYLMARNSANHTIYETPDPSPSENIMLAYADFNDIMIEEGANLQWHHVTNPIQDAWHHTNNGTFRRPNNSLHADDFGNVYLVGHHNSYYLDDAGESQVSMEPNVNVFMLNDYGEGEWSHVSGNAQVFFENPIVDPDTGERYISHDGDPLPAEGHTYWGITSSGHYNTVMGHDGKLLFPTTMTINIIEGFYYPAFHFPKVIAIDPNNGDIEVRDIYPRKDSEDNVNTVYTPWDVVAPFGEPENVWHEDAQQWYFEMDLYWPFPHWDTGLHGDAMLFHYNNMKITQPNEDGLTVAVWQDCIRAKDYNEYQTEGYEDYQNSPEIMISASSDSGKTWSDPIVLNNVDFPTEFHNMKPMWVYPADEVITVSDRPGGETVGKVGIMFLDDFTWGSNAVTPSAHDHNDGGNVMFMELQITFPGDSVSVEDGTAPSVVNMLNQNYPNPFNPETTISFDMPGTANAKVEVFNVKGQLVKTLFNEVAPYGRNSVVWSGDDNSGNKVSSGVYFYRLNTEFGSQTRKMMLMK